MTRGITVDRLLLHSHLWDLADRSGKVTIYQKGLAETMGITQATMSICVRALAAEGRIRKIASRANNVGVYQVRDPSLYPHNYTPGQESPVPGLFRCALCGEFEPTGNHLAIAK